MSRLLTKICRPRVSVPLALLVVAAMVLFGFLSTRQTPHPAINETTYARIREGMTRAEVEDLLGGPPRSEASGPEIDVWNRIVKDRWGDWIIPPRLRSVAHIVTEEEAKKLEAEFAAKQKRHTFDICEDGKYLVCWYHDLATITVVFDEETDRVKGAGLWTPPEQTWRDMPPARWWFRR
jgi:hypothetical protein